MNVVSAACCPTAGLVEDAVTSTVAVADDGAALADPAAFAVETGDGRSSLHLMVQNLHCAACIAKIETALKALPGMETARVNMSTRRLVATWIGDDTSAAGVLATVARLGYPARPYDPSQVAGLADDEGRRLLSAMAVAGFAAANVMLLSVAVWAGHGGGMGDGTRTLFHWISALIALPAVAFAGRPFFASAWGALRVRALNMDVPISLAVILAAGMSVHQTWTRAEHAYFDASVTLLFFLLVGRYLDRRARSRARSAAEQMLGLQARAAVVVDADGCHRSLPLTMIEPDMILAVAAGERIPADGALLSGNTDVDTSLVTGESLPRTVSPGDPVHAGMVNLAAPILMRVTAAGEATLLAEIVRLMEAAEQGRARYVRLADRIARFYAPAVHILAAATFLGWWALAGAGWQVSLMAAIAVLIITCPCALGLAVPVVQVVATGRLFRAGILIKSADALERLAQVDHVVFDKTGTLTTGQLRLVGNYGDTDLATAAALARQSRHPLSRALAAAAGPLPAPTATDIEEHPGAGLQGMIDGRTLRIGSAAWCGVEPTAGKDDGQPKLWMQSGDDEPVRFTFEDTLRPDAGAVIDHLRRRGVGVTLLSGDREPPVERVGQALGIDDRYAHCTPADKLAHLASLDACGRRVLMVGDGLNDAPALAAGFVSMSPASAADVSQTAADVVFQGEGLGAVTEALATARAAGRLVRQNLGLAFLYNAIAVPVAMAGLATPLIAAIAMSSSSVAVTLNALRLRLGRTGS